MSNDTKNPTQTQHAATLYDCCGLAPIVVSEIERCRPCAEDLARDIAKVHELLGVVRAWGQQQGMTPRELEQKIEHMLGVYATVSDRAN